MTFDFHTMAVKHGLVLSDTDKKKLNHARAQKRIYEYQRRKNRDRLRYPNAW